MRRMRCECGCKESAWECGESGRKYKNIGNQGGDARNQGGNLSIVVEITWNSNGNHKLKDWREVKIINLVSRVLPRVFLVNFEHI